MDKDQAARRLASVDAFYSTIQIASDMLLEAGCTPLPLFPDGTLTIVALDRRWNLVGRWYQRGGRVELRGSRVIEYWGTEGGLAQLANGGPTDSTRLLEPGLVAFREAAALPVWKCNEKAWADHVS